MLPEQQILAGQQILEPQITIKRYIPATLSTKSFLFFENTYRFTLRKDELPIPNTAFSPFSVSFEELIQELKADLAMDPTTSMRTYSITFDSVCFYAHGLRIIIENLENNKTLRNLSFKSCYLVLDNPSTNSATLMTPIPDQYPTKKTPYNKKQAIEIIRELLIAMPAPSYNIGHQPIPLLADDNNANTPMLIPIPSLVRSQEYPRAAHQTPGLRPGSIS